VFIIEVSVLFFYCNCAKVPATLKDAKPGSKFDPLQGSAPQLNKTFIVH